MMGPISRRAVLSASVPLVLGRRSAAGERGDILQGGVARLEQRHGGRLGVALLHGATGAVVAFRGDERFPLCSTYKVLAAAAVLARVDRGEESLGRRIAYSVADLVPYSPVTGPLAGPPGVTVGDLCDAAVTLSDNTAGNLLLDSVGGPDGLTAYMRSLGDATTRSDRREPELNEAAPGDPRDTTTPVAMLRSLGRIVLGNALTPASREQVRAWLVKSRTGAKLLRAGFPPEWSAGDKSGAGERNTRADVAAAWRDGHGPMAVTAYYTGSNASADERDAVLAEVGSLAAAMWAVARQ